MKVDRYTKVVLTVIALCLGCIAGKDVYFVPKAHAQFPIYESKTVDVNIVSIAGNKFLGLDVTAMYPYLPVKIFK